MQNSDPKTTPKRTRKLSAELIAVWLEMKVRGITPKDLAEQIGVSVSTIHVLLSGHYRRPGLPKKVEIALGKPFWSSDGEFQKLMAEHQAQKRN